MNIPFTVEQFFTVFKNYNEAIWPAQIIAYILGIAALALAIRRTNPSDRIISGILAIFWVWMGIFYHILHFSVINPAARIFGIVFILQGLLFLAAGTFLGKLSFRFTAAPLPVLGALFILYAMVIYPLLGIFFGHIYPAAPMFGVAPCPTTIFTIGILLWTAKKVPGYLLIIPFLWSLIGMSAAIHLRVPQDYGLVVSVVIGTILILVRNRRMKNAAS
ncbi:MAG: hypothetical protein EG826_07005 [Deltaproteobacteria bacterium]|nr:hypothetical protein [Deltaproteobacteria bacterium]